MYSRKKRLKKLGIDLGLMFIGLIIVIGVLYLFQMSFSLRRQTDNAAAKFDVAAKRVETHKKEAEEFLIRFDSFSKSKADAVAYFYNLNPQQISDISEMADQWELKELYVLDKDRKITASNTSKEIDFTNTEKFEELFAESKAVADGDIRYYISEIDENTTLIAGRDWSDCKKSMDEMTELSTSLSSIRIGSTGHMVAIDKNENTLLFDPQYMNIGRTLEEVGFSDTSIKNGDTGWIDYDGTRYFTSCKTLDDNTLLLSMIPKDEISKIDRKLISLAIIVFAAVVLIMIIYIHLIRIENAQMRETEGTIEYVRIHGKWYLNKSIGKKVKKVIIIGMVFTVLFSYYVQTLGSLSRQSNRANEKQSDIEAIIRENHNKLNTFTTEYNNEYSRRAENIAYLIGKDPTLVDSDKLEVLARKAQIKMIYVFDKRGRVDATSEGYTDFVLSTEVESQSYPFWEVVKGHQDVLVQEAQKDDTAGEMVQYCGVKRIDKPGMVQIGIAPQRLESRIRTTKVDYILQNIAVENKGRLIGIDEKTKKITYSSVSEEIGKAASSVGIKKAAYEDGYTGYQTVDSQMSLLSTNVYEGTIICLMYPLSTINEGRLTMTLLVALLSFIIILVIALISVIENITVLRNERMEGEVIEERENQAIIEISSRSTGEMKRVQTASSRWLGDGKIPWKECSADEKLVKILGYLIGLVSIGLVLFIIFSRNNYDPTAIISYLIHKKWEYIPNIFSITYIAIIMIEVVVFSTIVRKVIMMLASSLGAKAETIGRLLDSFIKYLSVLGALFYGMNYIGVDSSTLLASAGLLSVIVGLGAQSLIGDILAGIFIVFEGEFRVGDIIEVDTWRGTVLEIGVRTTKVEDLSGNIKAFNNAQITGIVNLTKKYSYASCDVGLEYEESLERVEHILKDALPEIKARISDIANGPFYKGVVELADSSVVIRIVAECQESARIQTTRDLNREIKLLFDKHNISIAYPQVVIHEPKFHQKASYSDVRGSEEFVEEQKKEASHILIND